MTDLRLDLGELGELHESLTAVAGHFADADQFGADVATAVGSIGALQYKALSFASNWDDTRRGINKNLLSLADSVEMIRETFEDLDAQLATHAEALAPEAI